MEALSGREYRMFTRTVLGPMRYVLGQGDDEAFHKWRIRVKNLYL